MNQVQDKTRLTDVVSDQWPPLAHITEDMPVRDGSLALCGAKLMGIELPDAAVVCTKCIKILKGMA